jgi:hypothetical protein
VFLIHEGTVEVLKGEKSLAELKDGGMYSLPFSLSLSTHVDSALGCVQPSLERLL